MAGFLDLIGFNGFFKESLRDEGFLKACRDCLALTSRVEHGLRGDLTTVAVTGADVRGKQLSSDLLGIEIVGLVRFIGDIDAKLGRFSMIGNLIK